MRNTIKIDSIIWLLSIVVIISAWFAGRFIEKKTSIDNIKVKLANYSIINQISANSYLAFQNDKITPSAYIAKGVGIGYGGRLSILIDIDSIANFHSIFILNNSETYSFLKKVINSGFIDDYKKLNLNQLSNNTNKPDAVSGATYTSQAIHQAIMAAAASISEEHFGVILDTNIERKFIFGLPEIMLILLYGIGFYINYHKTRAIKLMRWFALFTSIIFIGFIARKMLTLSQIGGYILGFWPNLYEFSFWYILLFGLLLGILLKGKNIYCDWVCPFGYSQELLGKIGKSKSPKIKFKSYLKWGQRFLALSALALGLIYRNPSKTSFEIFSGLFVFTGSDLLFIALALSIIASLFIKNPWCNYLCPVKPSIDFLRKFKEILYNKF